MKICLFTPSFLPKLGGMECVLDKVILTALGPTATVLSHDLCGGGYQAIDIGALDLDYEWFLRKEVELGAPLEFKYVDSGKKGRTVRQLEDPEYRRQITKTIL